MSRPKIAAVVLAVAVAAGLGIYVLRPGPSTNRPQTAGANAPAVRPAGGPLTAAERPALAAGPATPPPGAGQPAVAGESVALGRSQTIATINGVAITGADVLAFRAIDGDRQTMSPEMYEFLTRRAIERELTLQAARARKIELTSTHDVQLAQVRANAEARGETDPAQLAFEDKDARAQLLLEEIATAEGAPPALPDDAAVDAYLKAHAGEVGPMPSDPQAVQELRVSIRQKLYEQLANAHHDYIRALLARLEAEARITR